MSIKRRLLEMWSQKRPVRVPCGPAEAYLPADLPVILAVAAALLPTFALARTVGGVTVGVIVSAGLATLTYLIVRALRVSTRDTEARKFAQARRNLRKIGQVAAKAPGCGSERVARESLNLYRSSVDALEKIEKGYRKEAKQLRYSCVSEEQLRSETTRLENRREEETRNLLCGLGEIEKAYRAIENGAREREAARKTLGEAEETLSMPVLDTQSAQQLREQTSKLRTLISDSIEINQTQAQARKELETITQQARDLRTVEDETWLRQR